RRHRRAGPRRLPPADHEAGYRRFARSRLGSPLAPARPAWPRRRGGARRRATSGGFLRHDPEISGFISVAEPRRFAADTGLAATLRLAASCCESGSQRSQKLAANGARRIFHAPDGARTRATNQGSRGVTILRTAAAGIRQRPLLRPLSGPADSSLSANQTRG